MHLKKKKKDNFACSAKCERSPFAIFFTLLTPWILFECEILFLLLFSFFVPVASSRQQCALLWISDETQTVVAVPEGIDSQ